MATLLGNLVQHLCVGLRRNSTEQVLARLSFVTELGTDNWLPSSVSRL